MQALRKSISNVSAVATRDEAYVFGIIVNCINARERCVVVGERAKRGKGARVMVLVWRDLCTFLMALANTELKTLTRRVRWSKIEWHDKHDLIDGSLCLIYFHAKVVVAVTDVHRFRMVKSHCHVWFVFFLKKLTLQLLLNLRAKNPAAPSFSSFGLKRMVLKKKSKI